MSILSKLLYRLYAIRRRDLRNFILRAVARLEGGEMVSSTLRSIFLDYHQIEIGLYSYGGCFDPRRVMAHTRIGRYCSFAEGVWILNRNHPIKFKSTHPYFFNTTLGYVEQERIPMRPTVIGNDVWIGQNAIILASVSNIGDGAVIGAGTIVTKNVPDFAVVVGNPDKIVKYRFSEQTIRKLKQERWWDKDIDDLRANLDDFTYVHEELGDTEESEFGYTKVDGSHE